MSVIMSEDKNELFVNCHCGCSDAVNIKIDDELEEYGYYAYITYMSGNWYRDQNDRILRVIGRKLKKIWAIIRNKNFYYSDITMSREEFEKFKEYINQF